MKGKACCFTGHRCVKTDKIEKLHIYIEELIKRGVNIFYAGGAIGFDTIAELEVLKLKEKYPQIKLCLVLPCSNEEQTKNWTEEQKILFYDILRKVDSIIYTSENYTKDCMMKRNLKLVTLSDYCICYYERKISGTGQTVRMAMKRKLEIINVAKLD